jgi:hypothetical protein
MEVNWDAEHGSLYAPAPREWTRARWIRQILDAAQAQGVVLQLTDQTEWIGVDQEVRAELVQACARSGGAV